MTTLYRPVLIESAEQAEALPEGAVATHGGTDGYAFEVAIRDQDGEWWSAPGGISQEEPAYTDQTITGWTALVPIEAEEEWALIYDGEEPSHYADEAEAREWAHIDGEGQAPSHRYTTTWEETP